jgi:hypothetical protein
VVQRSDHHGAARRGAAVNGGGSVTREEIVNAVQVLPFGADVQVNVGGFYVDVTKVHYDAARHSIVLDLLSDDAEYAMWHFVKAGPLDFGTGNTL